MNLAAGAILEGVFTTSMLSGVLDELIAVVPTVIPVAISYLAVRKAIGQVEADLKSKYEAGRLNLMAC